MRIRFTADHDEVSPDRTIAYQAGAEEAVRKELGEALIAAGKAEPVAEPAPKPAAPAAAAAANPDGR
jgi:hypothetical protein